MGSRLREVSLPRESENEPLSRSKSEGEREEIP